MNAHNFFKPFSSLFVSLFFRLFQHIIITLYTCHHHRGRRKEESQPLPPPSPRAVCSSTMDVVDQLDCQGCIRTRNGIAPALPGCYVHALVCIALTLAQRPCRCSKREMCGISGQEQLGNLDAPAPHTLSFTAQAPQSARCITMQPLKPLPKCELGESVVQLRNVTKHYPIVGRSDAVQALKGVCIGDGYPVGPIRRGEFVILRGPSGGGKTTLLNLIGCIDKVTSGSIEMMGHEITVAATDDFLADLRLRSIGFVFQTFNLLGAFSAYVAQLVLPNAPPRATSPDHHEVALTPSWQL